MKKQVKEQLHRATTNPGRTKNKRGDTLPARIETKGARDEEEISIFLAFGVSMATSSGVIIPNQRNVDRSREAVQFGRSAATRIQRKVVPSPVLVPSPVRLQLHKPKLRYQLVLADLVASVRVLRLNLLRSWKRSLQGESFSIPKRCSETLRLVAPSTRANS